MSTRILRGMAQRHSTSPLLLLLKVESAMGPLRWIWITVTRDVSYSNTGTWQNDTAILWVSSSDFVAAMSRFSETPNAEVSLTFEDTALINNVNLLEYATVQLKFSRTALRLQDWRLARGQRGEAQRPVT